MAYEKQHKLHILSVVAVIRRDDGRILLLRRRKDETVYPDYFTFPGGKVEGNDTITETLQKEVNEECGLELNPGLILIKEKSIGRPDGQTSKSLSFLCTVKDDSHIALDQNDFTEYKWVNREELEQLKHVGIEAEFDRVEAIIRSGSQTEPFFTDTDKVDFRK
jgi:8-oxo-dGTP pyrophosphatase MutT (NUDIX family)